MFDQGYGNQTFTAEYDLHIKWKNVNRELDRTLFTIEGVDVSQGRFLIIDDRSDSEKPTIIQHPSILSAATLEKMNALDSR